MTDLTLLKRVREALFRSLGFYNHGRPLNKGWAAAVSRVVADLDAEIARGEAEEQAPDAHRAFVRQVGRMEHTCDDGASPPDDPSDAVHALDGLIGKARDLMAAMPARISPAASAPTDWVVVPRKAIKRQVKRGRAEIGGGSTFRQDEREEMAEAVYEAMLAAAPEPPAAEGWRPISDVDARPSHIEVRLVCTYRWRAYTPQAAQQMKRAGRWQRVGEYGGWDNADLPEGAEFRVLPPPPEA